jgi:peptidoglycan hydrolase CwlO-like protein
MIKKIAFAAGLVAVGLLVLHVTGLSSYPATAFGKLKKSVKQQVPLEFEIERLRHQVAQLVPDMRKHLSSIAEEMATIDALKEEITQTRANLAKQKENILAMTREVESGASTVSIKGREYGIARIREKLERDFASYQHCESELKTREKLLEAKEKSLDAARDQLGTMKTQKQELEVQVAQLEAELKTIRVAQSRNKFQIDDSSLAKCKTTLAEIRNRLKVEKTTAELEGEFANDALPVESKVKSTSDITREIKGYFHGDTVSESKIAADRK